MKGQVIVTGASRGIGRALCLELARLGHPLVVTARSRPELDTLAAEVAERFKVACAVVPCDLGTPAGRQELFTRAGATGLPTVGLVNNAGIGTAGAFEGIDAAKELDMVRLNVEAVVDLCHQFLPRLRGQPGAFILNVASTAGFQPVPLFATYSATKSFVLIFSEAIAEELAPQGIHVMALCPGITVTGFQSEADIVVPPGKHATPEEVAAYAIKALAARKRVAVHGAMNAARAFSARLAPRVVVAKVAKKVMEPWFKHRAKG